MSSGIDIILQFFLAVARFQIIREFQNAEFNTLYGFTEGMLETFCSAGP